MVTIERLNEIVIYNNETGVFTSKVSRPGVKKGALLGTVRKSNGYLQICIDRKLYYAHRLAMIILGHEISGAQIDHIDGDKLNNSEKNLRVCRNFENVQNIKKHYKNSSTGVLGVSRANQKVGYTAQISCNNKVIHLGTFKTIDEASAAYLSAKRMFHEFNTI